MKKKLKNLHLKFLKFFQKKFIEDRQVWFGVKEAKIPLSQIKKIFFHYEKGSFFEFCKKTKDVLFSKNPFFEVPPKWSSDLWEPSYYFEFLKKNGLIKVAKNKIVPDQKFISFFPCPQSEEKIKRKLEKKLKMKVFLEKPISSLFHFSIKQKYDQLPISVKSAIFLAKKILEYLPLYERFLFIGDDDFMSVILSLADEKFKATVVDIDEKLLAKIKELSQKFKLDIKTKKVDILKAKKIKGNFVGFLTSPVYTFEGVKAFVDFGTNSLGKEGGFAFLNLADEAIGNRYLFLQEFFAKKRLKIEEVIKGQIFYPFQSIHPEDKILFFRLKKFFPQVLKNLNLISSSLWIFNYVPFKIPYPKKQPIYAYV